MLVGGFSGSEYLFKRVDVSLCSTFVVCHLANIFSFLASVDGGFSDDHYRPLILTF